jgi:hypothetical protein
LNDVVLRVYSGDELLRRRLRAYVLLESFKQLNFSITSQNILNKMKERANRTQSDNDKQRLHLRQMLISTFHNENLMPECLFI